MKRKITSEQLNELTDEQKQKLKKWWKPKYGDFAMDFRGIEIIMKPFIANFYFDLYGKEGVQKFTDTVLPLLSVSQMIELFESKDYFFSISKEIACDDLGCLNWGWLIEINTKESPHQIEYMEFSTDGLADCLWKAVKTIL